MKIPKLFLFCVVLLVGLAAWSQEAPRAEVAADFSYARFYPVARGTQSLSLNGGGGALVVNINDYVGIKMDLQGYGSNTIRWTNPAGGSLTAQGNLFTYMFGPQVKFRAPKFEPFVQWLLGGAHSNAYGNLTKACTGACTISGSPAGNAFAMAIGGGFDIPVNKSVEIRPVEIDYLMTRFTNQFNNSSQNNFRYSGGVNFRFGGSKQVSQSLADTTRCKGTDAAFPRGRFVRWWRSCPEPETLRHLPPGLIHAQHWICTYHAGLQNGTTGCLMGTAATGHLPLLTQTESYDMAPAS